MRISSTRLRQFWALVIVTAMLMLASILPNGQVLAVGSGPGGGGDSIDTALNMSMVLMLASAAVAVYAEIQCQQVMSVHIYSSTATSFVASYLLQIQSTADEIDSIMVRYANFDFTSSSADLSAANKDQQREAFVLCQQEQQYVADSLREIAMLHYLAAAGFAAAAAWAMLMEGPKTPPPQCVVGKMCNGLPPGCFVQNLPDRRWSPLWEAILPSGLATTEPVMLHQEAMKNTFPGSDAWHQIHGTGDYAGQMEGPQLLDFYWKRALVFAAFSAFALGVGMMYDADAGKYDEQANACATLIKKLDETSATDPGISLTGLFDQIHRIWQQFTQRPLPVAQGAAVAGAKNGFCFQRNSEQLPEPVACERCQSQVTCLIPTIPAKHPWLTNLPPIFQQALRQVGEVEYFTYSGQYEQARESLQAMTKNRQLWQPELLRMFQHYEGQMRASGMPEFPVEQFADQALPEVQAMGRDFLAKKNPAARSAFLATYQLKMPLQQLPQQTQSVLEVKELEDELIRMEDEQEKTLDNKNTLELPAHLSEHFERLLEQSEIHGPDEGLFQIISHRYLQHFQDFDQSIY